MWPFRQLHSSDDKLSVIHFVVNNIEKLHRIVNGVEAPSMEHTTTSILVINMLGPVIHKHGPLFAAPKISKYVILKKITLTTIGEVVVWCLHFNMPE